MNDLDYDEIIDRLRTKFMDFDVNFDHFNELLQKHNAFISGSFILQVIQNEFYPAENYDIDIFTFGEKNEELESELDIIIKKSILHKIIKKKINVVKENRRFKYYKERLLKKKVDGEKIEDVYEEDIIDHHKCCKSKYTNLQIISDEQDIEKINLNSPIKINTKLLNNWNDTHKMWGLTNKDSINLSMYKQHYDVEIISKYKSINICKQKNIRIAEDYSFDKINEIVDFTVTNNVMKKYQLIYYDNNVMHTPEDILKGFDLVFCANYWNGKKLFIKDYDSIKTKSFILNLIKPRIYRNQNNRIIKYINRNFDIKIRYNDNIYEILQLNYDHENNKLYKVKELNEDINNLIIIPNDPYFSINSVLNSLPFGLEKLIIYTYNAETIIDNLPTSLQELKLYLWKTGSGNETGTYILDIDEYNDIQKSRIEKKYKKNINKAITGLKKIPFGCKVYINDDLIEL